MTQTPANTPEEIEVLFAAIAKFPDDIRDQAFAAAGLNPGMFKALAQALEQNDPMAAVHYMRQHPGANRPRFEFMIEGLAGTRMMELKGVPVAAEEPVWDPQAEEDQLSPSEFMRRAEAERDAAGVGDGTPTPVPDPLPDNVLQLPPPGPAQPPKYGTGANRPADTDEPAPPFYDRERATAVSNLDGLSRGKINQVIMDSFSVAVERDGPGERLPPRKRIPICTCDPRSEFGGVICRKKSRVCRCASSPRHPAKFPGHAGRLPRRGGRP